MDTDPNSPNDAAPDHHDIALVAMPFALAESPSIQLGILKALLDREDLPCVTRSYHVAFLDHLLRAPRPAGVTFALADYEMLSGSIDIASEWVFKAALFGPRSAEDDERFFAYVASLGLPETYPTLLRFVEGQVASFVAWCVEDLLRTGARVVGFTTTFAQNLAALALARALRERAPDVRIVFGGANVDGPMGAALHRAFPFVDVVVRGEGEPVVAALMRDLLAGGDVRAQAGLCVRRDGASVAIPQAASAFPMDDVPTPDYDEYFARIAASPAHHTLAQKVRLQVESARGCWWGQKNHCTFCGLNGGSMAFRSKSPARALEDLVTLAGRHRVLDFTAVDNIIDLAYLREMLPLVRESEHDFQLFYETKSNLSKADLRTMREAGVYSIQPGIESLSTPILTAMKKGVTALQNIRLVKWCTELGITPHWNLLYGFPNEPVEEYARMTRLVDDLVHLPAPNVFPLCIHRFSPYHDRPEHYGIALDGPHRAYEHLYALDAVTRSEIAYAFAYRHADGRDPETYARPLANAVHAWRERARAGGALLHYQRGPGFVQIVDKRTKGAERRLLLEGAQAEIFLACDAGASAGALTRLVAQHGVEEEEVRDFLGELAAAGLVYTENDRHLSLPLYLDVVRAGITRKDVAEPEVARPLVQLARKKQRPLAAP